jgi:hypothetical protein
MSRGLRLRGRSVTRSADCVTRRTDRDESAFTAAKCTPPGGGILINVKRESNAVVCDILELCGRRIGLDAARTATETHRAVGAADQLTARECEIFRNVELD